MYCKHCGFQLPDQATFCTNCGGDLTGWNRPAVRTDSPRTAQPNETPATQSLAAPAAAAAPPLPDDPRPVQPIPPQAIPPQAIPPQPFQPQPIVPEEREASKRVLTWGIIALAFACSFFLSFLGIFFAAKAKREVRAYQERFGAPHGRAKVGSVFSIVALPVSIVMTVLCVIYWTIIAATLGLVVHYAVNG